MSDGQHEAAMRERAMAENSEEEQALTAERAIGMAVAAIGRANMALNEARAALSQALWCLRSEHERARKSCGGAKG